MKSLIHVGRGCEQEGDLFYIQDKQAEITDLTEDGKVFCYRLLDSDLPGTMSVRVLRELGIELVREVETYAFPTEVGTVIRIADIDETAEEAVIAERMGRGWMTFIHDRPLSDELIAKILENRSYTVLWPKEKN